MELLLLCKKDGITVAGFVTNLVTAIINYRDFDGNLVNYSIIEEKKLNLFNQEKQRFLF